MKALLVPHDRAERRPPIVVRRFVDLAKLHLPDLHDELLALGISEICGFFDGLLVPDAFVFFFELFFQAKLNQQRKASVGFGGKMGFGFRGFLQDISLSFGDIDI